MIKFNCDNCEMLIELDDDQAGTKHECLSCGDINRVPDSDAVEPGPVSTSGPVDRAVKAGYPADFGPETKILKVRRCWFRSRPIRFGVVLLVVIASIVGMIWAQLGDRSVAWYALFAPLALGGFGLLVWWWLDRLSASFEITTKRTIMHRGFFSKSSSEVVHDNIRNIQIDQTFLQRLANVGRIGISSSGQDGVEIQVNHLANPDKLREIIDLYRPL
ncbi:MAG: PH domain-containing protein [Phycisphaerales bacterium]|nr:PH domain-containing protein [Phycisphaerales bacterium]